MSTTTTQPGRKNPAPRKKSIPSNAAEEPTARQQPAAGASSSDGQPAAAPLAERDAEHALELTLEALSVDHQTAERIQKLPHDIGWLLVTAGVVGVVMPGVLGVPFLVLGGLILMPATNQKAERWLTGHSPKIFKGSIRQINRFLDDLERRYPKRRP